jgi:MYXO-CTERM domain-containing protein
LSGRRTGRSSGLLRRIGHALVIGYLLHLLFAGSGGGGFILLLIIVALFFAHRRRRRAREYYGGQRGAWR